MDSVLIVSNTPNTLNIISRLLSTRQLSRVATCSTGQDARCTLVDGYFDLVIIDAPLPDEGGDDFALYAAERGGAGVILIVEGSAIYDMASDVEDAGVFILPKPISPELFSQAAKLLMACRARMKVLENENNRLHRKIEEIRLVDRAKCVLIQTLNMTETQAHRYIEKQAMDLRTSKTDVAEGVLKTYER